MIMKTIRKKIAFVFAAFMAFLVLFSIFLNAMFLEKFYIYKNRDVFIDAEKSIEGEYISDQGDISNFINLFDRAVGISCVIADSKGNVKYSSSPVKPEEEALRLPSEISKLIQDNESSLVNSYIYGVTEKPNDQAAKLTFIMELYNSDLIILRKPLSGISESVSIANQFYIFSGLLMIVLGGIFIYILTNKITKPIIDMSSVAESISKLDFTKRVAYSSTDEIGKLGDSINRMSDKLNVSLNSLKKDVERRKELVRNISHELKSPIGVIKGYAEGLKYGVANDREKADRYCTIIAEECDRMDSLVRELLNLSMLESGMFSLNASNFNLNDLISKIAHKFEQIFKEKNISLKLEVEKDLWLIADPELVERALSNYLVNAANHIGGERAVKIDAVRKASGVRISVYNTGNHIPEDEISSIWDIFYKCDKARTRQYGGHGLGLSIVRLIADIHGGAAGVENAEDGVLFYIEIP
jgi:signal transduction histidine kinase